SDVSQFESIIVKSRAPSTEASQVQNPVDTGETATIVRIRDVAKVELSQEAFSTFSGLSGKKAAQMNVYTLPGANALKVSQEVRALMAQMSEKFPPGLKYDALLDSSTFIKDSIGGVYQALIEAGVLVLIVIILFLQNFRAMLVPATTVPVTIIGAFAAMALLGFTVNLMTLFALILSIGIVVDDAIVIVENASHYIEQGLTPKDAAIKAMSELTGPVLGITLVLTSLYLRAVDKNKKINWFFRGFNQGYEVVERHYISIVRWMTQRPRAMAGVFFVVVGLGAFAFAVYPTALMPLEDQGYCILISQLPQGSSQPRVRELAEKIDTVLKNVAGLKGWVTIGGYSGIDSAKLSNVITTFVVFQDWGKRPKGFTLPSIIAELQAKFRTVAMGQFSVLPPTPIPGLGNAFGFQMMVENRNSLGLGELQKGVQQILLKAHQRPGFMRVGFTTFSDSSPQVYVDIDRTKARALGVTLNDVFKSLQAYMGSSYVNLFNKFNQSFQVRVQAESN